MNLTRKILSHIATCMTISSLATMLYVSITGISNHVFTNALLFLIVGHCLYKCNEPKRDENPSDANPSD